LTKDRDALLAFYDFLAEHWKHLRTTNPIESSFATVRHRTVRAKGCLSNKTALAMIFKLAEAAEKSWRRLDGYNQLPKLICGVKFTDGIELVRPKVQAAAGTVGGVPFGCRSGVPIACRLTSSRGHSLFSDPSCRGRCRLVGAVSVRMSLGLFGGLHVLELSEEQKVIDDLQRPTDNKRPPSER